MLAPQQIQTAINTLSFLENAADDREMAADIKNVIEILSWVLEDKERGVGFGKFMALTCSRVDRFQAEDRDAVAKGDA